MLVQDPSSMTEVGLGSFWRVWERIDISRHHWCRAVAHVPSLDQEYDTAAQLQLAHAKLCGVLYIPHHIENERQAEHHGAAISAAASRLTMSSWGRPLRVTAAITTSSRGTPARRFRSIWCVMLAMGSVLAPPRSKRPPKYARGAVAAATDPTIGCDDAVSDRSPLRAAAGEFDVMAWLIVPVPSSTRSKCTAVPCATKSGSRIGRRLRAVASVSSYGAYRCGATAANLITTAIPTVPALCAPAMQWMRTEAPRLSATSTTANTGSKYASTAADVAVAVGCRECSPHKRAVVRNADLVSPA
eukprot:m.391862 g.391862  ORF g.391862 m.391862 type:complete len:301 (-) comp28318_c0_seq6:1052-1954(-)